MTKHFQNEIERLKKKILHMAALVEEALELSVNAAIDRDVGLAQRVISADSGIDAFEIEVEEECLKILALHQPVAADLRYVVAVLKINNDLERIADLAVNIAERALDLATTAEHSVPYDLSSMLEAAVGMVRQSVDALVRRDVTAAQQVRLDDDQVDNLHKSAHRAVIENIRRSPEKGDYLISLLSISRNLERIADHATNVAEDVIYMVEGEIVRHSGGNAPRDRDGDSAPNC
jgi:phosphate transport system protein